jgi:peroxiredoxin
MKIGRLLVLLPALAASLSALPSAKAIEGFKEPAPREIVLPRFTDRDIDRLIATLDGLLSQEKDSARWGENAADHLWTFVERLQAGRLTATQQAHVAAHFDELEKSHPADVELIERERHVLTSLTIGKMAPEITGIDLDGQPLKLSDYRGRVVVLTFSGNWCGACRGEYPYLRLMGELYKDRPFSIVSVNSDSELEKARASKAEHGLEFKSWWDGYAKKNTRGPIASSWGVVGWPTIYLLDDQGVIRFVNLRQEDLLKGVKQLLNELSAKSSRPATK